MPPNYDSLLGKLIVWAEDRDQAIARMKRALSETVISGVPTTIDYHQLILDTKDFRDGNVDTGALCHHWVLLPFLVRVCLSARGLSNGRHRAAYYLLPCRVSETHASVTGRHVTFVHSMPCRLHSITR